MSPSLLPSASCEETARLLAYGLDLARDWKDDRADVGDAVWHALQDAVSVLDASPDREKMWLRSGTRTSFKDAGMTPSDLAALTRERVLSGMATHDGGSWNKLRRDRDIDRALAVLDWLMHIRNGKDGDKLATATLAVLRGDKRGIAAKVYAPERSLEDRRKVHYEIKQRAVRAILVGIGRQHTCKAEIILRDASKPVRSAA